MREALIVVACVSVLASFIPSVSVAAPALPQAVAKQAVASVDDLPRFSYPIEGRASALLTDEVAFAELAAKVRADIEATLAQYDITDRSTLRGLHRTLLDIALIEGDQTVARRQIATLRDLQDKGADRAQSGLLETAYLDALAQSPVGEAAFNARFQALYAQAIAPLPWALVGDSLQEEAGTMEFLSPAILIGAVDQAVQPAIDSGGAIGGEAAAGLVGSVATQRIYLAVKAPMLAALRTYIEANAVAKADIWAAREAEFPAGVALTPVVVGIWDSGLDTSLFGGRLWVNAAESVNGLDDDGNGYVDDVHGIAFDESGVRQASLLAPVPDSVAPRLDRTRGLMQGLNDQQAGVRSPAAAELVAFAGQATPVQMQEMISDLGFYGGYGHGTHVAGIVAEGNPAVRMVGARASFDWRSPPRRPTTETATQLAQMHRDIVSYMKAAGVRVVNMSWTVDLKTEYEDQLEANGVPAGEREEEARRLFAIESGGLREAIASAPEILFVAAAGNSNDSAGFSGAIPASIDAANVLTIAAVDQAGEPTGFTSGGPTVDLAANGFEVESFVPGGARQAWSGTSMASPQVVNLAARLLAVKPQLTIVELRALLVDTATATDAGYRLINPAAAMEAVSP